MSECLMSERTAELLLLLYNDGVDHEELKALVRSAFEDGINYTIEQVSNTGGQGNN